MGFGVQGFGSVHPEGLIDLAASIVIVAGKHRDHGVAVRVQDSEDFLQTPSKFNPEPSIKDPIGAPSPNADMYAVSAPVAPFLALFLSFFLGGKGASPRAFAPAPVFRAPPGWLV